MPEQLDKEDNSSKEVTMFDFLRPHKVSDTQLRTLKEVHERFCETLGASLVNQLKTDVRIEVTSIEQMFYSDFVQAVANPSCLYLSRIGESNAMMILEITPPFGLFIVEKLLGGSGCEIVKPRALTTIERRVLRGVAQQAITNLQHSWEAIAELTLTLERFESMADFAQISPTSEMVLVILFKVAVGKRQFQMTVCFPKIAVDAIHMKLNVEHPCNDKQSSNGEGRMNILVGLRQTSVTGTGTLEETDLTIQELIGLELGDIIRTTIPIDGETKVIIGGKPRLRGRLGISNGNKAIRITKFLNAQEEGDE